MEIHLPLRDDLIAIVDIVQGSVRAAIVSGRRGHPLTVHAHAYGLIAIDEETAEHAIAALSSRIEETCTRVHNVVTEKGIRGRIKTAYCFVHEPWAHSGVSRAREDYTEETRIRDAHISKVAAVALSRIKEMEPKGMVEAAVLRTWFNGYPVSNPDNKSAHSLAVSVIGSEIDERVRKRAEAAIHRSFPVAEIKWRSFSRAVQQTLGALYLQDENYLAVDMCLDTTHILSVRDGILSGEKIVPEGVRTILKRLDPKRPAEETLGYIRMLIRDACEGTACEAIQKAMAVVEPELVKVFGSAFSALASERKLANSLVLIAHPDIIDWMKQFFSRIDFSQFTTTTLPLSVATYDAGLAGLTVDSPLHAALALDSSFVNRELQD